MAENQVYLIKSGQNSFVEETEAIIGISGGRLGVGTTTPEADLHVTGSVKIGGDLAVDGTFTTINSNTISVDDKNIELGSTDNPTDVTADGGGITVKGASDKTFNWSGNNSAWTSSEHLHLANGKHFSADELRALDSDGLKLVDQTTSGVLIKGGKVGIHQASPVYDLDVDGSGNFTSLYVGGNAVLTGEGSIFGKWEDGVTQGEIFYTGGNVGVGTNNPEHPLHVSGNAVVDGNFIVNGTSGNLNVSNFNVSGDSIVLNYRGDALASDRGGLTVRTNTEDKSFEYVGGSSDFWLSSENIQINPGKELQTDKVRAIDGDGLYLHDDNGNGIFIEDGGNVGIKNITPSVALDVSGSAKISADLNVLDDIVAGGSISVGVGKFNVSNDGAVGGAAPGANDVIKWSSTQGKWIAGTSPGGGGSSSSEVPLAFAAYLDSANGSEHPIVFPDAPVGGYDDVPSIATDLEIEGDGPLVPYYISGLSNTGYYAVFAQDIAVDNSYKLHTTFGGRDVFWRTGVDAGSIYYNLGDVSIGNNLTVGGNLTVNGTTTTVNTETVEIKDHNLVIASNTGYNQLTSEYPGAGDGYAGLYWGTGDNPNPSPVSLTYQTNKGFAFEGGNVGIGTTNPSAKLQVDAQAGEYSLNTDNFNQVGLLIKSSAVAGKDAKGGSIAFTSVAGGGGKHAAITAVQTDNDSNNVGLAFEVHSGGTSNDPLIEAMRIDRNGNVGIGTTNPVYKFHIADEAASNLLIQKTTAGGNVDGITLNSIADANTGINNRTGDISLIMTDTAGDSEPALRFSTTNGGGGTKHTMFITNGNVGIGTTDPDFDLSVVSNTDPAKIGIHGYGSFSDGTVAAQLLFLGKDSNEGNRNLAHIQVREHSHPSGTGSMEFFTRKGGNEAARMVISDDGNVGIGTTNPGVELDVAGSAIVSGSMKVSGLLYANANSSSFQASQTISVTVPSVAQGSVYQVIATRHTNTTDSSELKVAYLHYSNNGTGYLVDGPSDFWQANVVLSVSGSTISVTNNTTSAVLTIRVLRVG